MAEERQRYMSPQRDEICVLTGRPARSLTVSGGFATMHPNNRLTINAIEAYPLEDFSQDVSCRTISVCLLSKAEAHL
jgi:F0F1-type ATP synthase epsilon subunit